jgi:hypothetical protein
MGINREGEPVGKKRHMKIFGGTTTHSKRKSLSKKEKINVAGTRTNRWNDSKQSGRVSMRCVAYDEIKKTD